MASKKILITGATGGIGNAVVNGLKNKYDFIGVDIKNAKSNNFLEFLKTDLRSQEEINNLCKKISASYKSLWALVFCAGVYPIIPFDKYTNQLWKEIHSVNLNSIFEITQRLFHKIEKGGRIIIVSSGAAHVGSRDIGYSSSKAATLGLVKSLSKILAPKKILVNAVCPGVIKTSMSERMSKEHKQEYIEAIPLKRIGLPKEVAVCISFLLDEENSYMTGATIDVNGGLYSR